MTLERTASLVPCDRRPLGTSFHVVQPRNYIVGQPVRRSGQGKLAVTFEVDQKAISR
ncbi:MAG: hypothetical protein ACOX1P_02375 [Thermoguttaceae bacterium]|jgi:hypothetical protein